MSTKKRVPYDAESARTSFKRKFAREDDYLEAAAIVQEFVPPTGHEDMVHALRQLKQEGVPYDAFNHAMTVAAYFLTNGMPLPVMDPVTGNLVTWWDDKHGGDLLMEMTRAQFATLQM